MSTAIPSDEFIPLDRTFHEITLTEDVSDDISLVRALGLGEPMRWPSLLNERRVILLSEAGSGKTTEIRHVARKLRQEEKPAFFVRIEYVSDQFDDSFEEGSIDEFNAWATSGQEGWIFLDSVDEARLRDPRDFERAIKKLGRLLSLVLQQAHIVITGRTHAWRAKTDLMLCRTALPYRDTSNVVDDNVTTKGDKAVATKTEGNRPNPAEPFRIVSLDDLHGDQVDVFARGKGIHDVKAFRLAVDRKDAGSLTTRPQDLAELAEFWIENRRIGSRLELMQRSIARRLEERDQNRSEARPIAIGKLRAGVRLIAAATTLGRQSAIEVPDGDSRGSGIPVRQVLPDWNDADCGALLSRPIFDEGIYGTVRFHHRSVREYLTAEWLHTLIVDEGSRTRIEGLFFRSQYGIDVIAPTMRPVLSWLAILDERILGRVCRLAPEVIFEGGDPSQLPLETRRAILRQACEQLSQPARSRSLTDHSGIQRFANVDLADDLRALFTEYCKHEEVVRFLLRMVWIGEIAGVSAEVKRLALISRNRSTRIAAFRALGATSTSDDQAEVRDALLVEDCPLLRDWLAELLPQIPHDSDSVRWLLQALERTEGRKEFDVDSLAGELPQLIAGLPIVLLPDLIVGLDALLKVPPVLERRHCEISKRYGWLLKSAAQAVIRAIDARNPSATSSASLATLRRLRVAKIYDHFDIQEVGEGLPEKVARWPELNHALFWHDVAETRASLEEDRGERLIDYWQASAYGHAWSFAAEDFDTICDEIEGRQLLDDKLVALTLAFSVYQQQGRRASWRARLKRLASAAPELNGTLAKLLHPPKRGRQKWRQQDARWKRQQVIEAARQRASKEKWRKHLEVHIDKLRDPGKPDFFTSHQAYLHERLRRNSERSNRWTEGHWETLVPEFGDEIARAFRDGAVRFWRGHCPPVLSDGASPNTTAGKVIFGLTGLAIEAREAPNWLDSLSPREAEIAARYAVHELNGFPTWLPSLYAAHPISVINVIATEIDYDLQIETEESQSHYVLADVGWSGDWMWDGLASFAVERLCEPRKNIRNLRYLLDIAQGSSLEDSAIATVAAQGAKAANDLELAPVWYAVWVGVAPAIAIPALAARLAEVDKTEDQTLFAMRFVAALVGGRRTHLRVRQAYRFVEHMKTLYLLMHKYIREDQDIERAGTGVYSPGLRDDAQDARNALLSFIRETPGKEAYLALVEASNAHPAVSARPWMTFLARSKAEADSDLTAWSPEQVREFHDRCEHTPGNHRDLWYLALDRLLDLKHNLEDGDTSIASILRAVDQETEMRNYIGNWCRDRSRGRYAVPQEEQLADAKRPDVRFHGVGFDGPVPVELKLADKWTGPRLFERLESQLCGDYLRDAHSSRGIFVLVYHGNRADWDLPSGKRANGFAGLISALQNHWLAIAPQYPGVEDVVVVGIDLTKRATSLKTPAKIKVARARGGATKPSPANKGPLLPKRSKAPRRGQRRLSR